MLKLSDKQRRFVACKLAGANNSDAYRDAYLTDTQREKKGSTEIARLAFGVAHSKGVEAALQKGRDEISEFINIDSKRYVNMLLNAADKAEAAKNFGAMIRAIELIGKHLGFFVERHEITTTNKTEVEIRASITHMVTANPKLLGFLENNTKNVLGIKKAEPVEALPIVEGEVVKVD